MLFLFSIHFCTSNEVENPNKVHVFFFLVGLSKEDLIKREQVANRVNELMKLHIPGSTVRHYGSSLSGFGLKDSDLNLDLQIPTEIPPHEALIKALHTLVLKSEEFSNVSPDFTAKIPTVTFFVQLEAGKNRLRYMNYSLKSKSI